MLQVVSFRVKRTTKAPKLNLSSQVRGISPFYNMFSGAICYMMIIICGIIVFFPQSSEKMPIIEESVEMQDLNPAQVNTMF